MAMNFDDAIAALTGKVWTGCVSVNVVPSLGFTEQPLEQLHTTTQSIDRT